MWTSARVLRAGLTILWHAYPKWHAGISPWHAASLLSQFPLFILPDQSLYNNNNNNNNNYYSAVGPVWAGTRAQSGDRYGSGTLHPGQVLRCSLPLLSPQSLYIVKYMCIYTLISDTVQTVYELPLLPNNTASETFLHKSGAVRNVDWIFIIGSPVWQWLGEYVTLGGTFYDLLFQQEAAAAPVVATCSCLPHSLLRPLFEI